MLDSAVRHAIMNLWLIMGFVYGSNKPRVALS